MKRIAVKNHRARPPAGTVQLLYIPERGPHRPASRRKHNQIQDEWAAIVARAAFQRDASCAVSAMYLEFENVDDPNDVVTPPAYDQDEGIEYYAALVDSPNRDFLRIMLTLQPSVSVVPGYEDSFRDGYGNRVTCFTQTQGTVGIHGKPFSHLNNSKVFGVALVATPFPTDRTRDLMFARTYFSGDDQAVKIASSAIGVTWQQNFVR